MAKKRRIPKEIPIHLSYCAGEGWVGDGSKATSACPFDHSKRIEAVRYMCHFCCTGVKSSDIFADANGINKNFVEKKAPQIVATTPQEPGQPVKRGRGRPKGSKNRSKVVA